MLKKCAYFNYLDLITLKKQLKSQLYENNFFFIHVEFLSLALCIFKYLRVIYLPYKIYLIDSSLKCFNEFYMEYLNLFSLLYL